MAGAASSAQPAGLLVPQAPAWRLGTVPGMAGANLQHTGGAQLPRQAPPAWPQPAAAESERREGRAHSLVEAACRRQF